MKVAFEQFEFLPRMFNLASGKVQDNGIWSVVGSGIIWSFTHLFNITVNVIGVSVGYSILLFIVMVTDFFTGVEASRKEWKKTHAKDDKFKTESKKGLRWAIKYMTYITGFYILNVLSKESQVLDISFLKGYGVDIVIVIFFIIRFWFMLYILRWELKSIDENFERLGLKFKMFDFFDNFLKAVSDVFKNKTGVDIDNENK